jgi:hypothetical protein
MGRPTDAVDRREARSAIMKPGDLVVHTRLGLRGRVVAVRTEPRVTNTITMQAEDATMVTVGMPWRGEWDVWADDLEPADPATWNVENTPTTARIGSTVKHVATGLLGRVTGAMRKTRRIGEKDLPFEVLAVQPLPNQTTLWWTDEVEVQDKPGGAL